MPSRESAHDKGRRLLTEGRLRVREIRDNGTIIAECKGDRGEIYAVGYSGPERRWGCTCPEMKGRCSHIVACQLVVVVEDD